MRNLFLPLTGSLLFSIENMVHPLSVVYNSKTRRLACFSFKPPGTRRKIA